MTLVQELEFFAHVTTTEATVRHHTERAGAAYVALQTEEVEHLKRTLPRLFLGIRLRFPTESSLWACLTPDRESRKPIIST